MRCPQCQFENGDIAQFCEECGARLIRTRPGCGQEVRPRDKFYAECGTLLTGHVATAWLDEGSADDASADVAWVEPLVAPPAVTVAALEPTREPSVSSIDLAPVQIPALEIRPIEDTPRERRKQE